MNEKDYTDLAVKVQEIDSRSKSTEYRVESLEDKIKGVQDTQISLIKIANSVENMGKSMASVNEKVDVISEKQDKLNDKVTVLENRPANETRKRWENILDKATWLVVGGLIVGVLAALFPSIPW